MTKRFFLAAGFRAPGYRHWQKARRVEECREPYGLQEDLLSFTVYRKEKVFEFGLGA